MGELSYRLVYEPSKKTDGYVNYICADNKIHLKFLNISKRKTIRGFEQKLSYLMTYLFKFSFSPSLVTEIGDKNQIKTLLNAFYKDPDVLQIKKISEWYLGDEDFKGFKILLNQKADAFGNLPFSAAPLNIDKDSGLILKSSLSFFLETLKISLVDYLFNDGYSIEIFNSKAHAVINEKFIKKQNKKYNKITSDIVSLW